MQRKLVIEIPDDLYKQIMMHHEGQTMREIMDHRDVIRNAIEDAIPLPEGYGNLIDADEMIEDLQRQCRELFRQDAVKLEDYYITKNAKFMQDTWKNWCDVFCEWAAHRPVIVKRDGRHEVAAGDDR